MKPNNGSGDIWLDAETTNKKLKQDAKTQDTDGMHAMSVLYTYTHMSVLYAYTHMSVLYTNVYDTVLQAPGSRTFPPRFRPRNTQHFKTKTV